MLHVRHLVFALILGTVVGCSSDSNEKDETAAVDEDSVTVKISAGKGGEVKLGGAALKIPAGALSEDLDVTLEAKQPASTLPEQGSLTGMTYDFGPDGTQFEKPVELTLPLEGKPGDGEEAVISWYDEETETWQDIAATVKGGAISAEVEHFTLFVVRFKGVAAGAFDCSFDACSGDGIEGTWKMAGVCVDTGEQDNPFGKVAGCEDAVFDVGVDAEGEATFGDDGTFNYHWIFTGSLNIGLSEPCLEAVGMGQACEDFEPDEGVSCVLEGDRCNCTGPGEADEQMGSGTYEVSGSTITFTNDDETDTDGPDERQICVKGDEAKVQEVKTELDEDTGKEVTETTMFVLTRM